MALERATNSGSGTNDNTLTIAPAQRRLANIQTAEVKQEVISRQLRAIGIIEIDEGRQATIASYIEGRIERLFADYTGVEVAAGDHLAIVYSPQLYTAQVEYLEARRANNSAESSSLYAIREAQRKLLMSSRQRLVEYGMTDTQLAQLDESEQPQSRLTVYAPTGGTVIEKMAEEGRYIKAGEPIYRIADLSTLWLMLELYPRDVAQIRFGQVVQAELSSLPGKKLRGRVAFIDPQVDQARRTVSVRVEFKNDRRELKPGDYAQADIRIPIGPQGDVYDAELANKWISPMHPQIIRNDPGICPLCGMDLVPTSRYGYTKEPVPQKKSLTVPRSAVLMAGKHSVVYVEIEPGRFEMREVAVGPVLREKVAIIDGVKPGEQVATSGNFLIDSQMQLAGKPSLIDPTKFLAPESKSPAPLEFGPVRVKRVTGQAGEWLEGLYRHYVDIQASLARDELPLQNSIDALLLAATQLETTESWDEGLDNEIQRIIEQAPLLREDSIDAVRAAFKPVSQAVITLATHVRGEAAENALTHFFCPMVKQGGGDWLQADTQLLNPYFGDAMLHCGELVRSLPPALSSFPAGEPFNEDGSHERLSPKGRE